MARKVRKLAPKSPKSSRRWQYKKYGKRPSRRRGLGDASFAPERAWREFEEQMAEAYARGQIGDDIQSAVGRLGDALYSLREVNGHAHLCDEIPDRAEHVKRTWNTVKAALTPAEAALASKVVTAVTGQARATCPAGTQPYTGKVYEPTVQTARAAPVTRQRGSFPAAESCGLVCKVKRFFGG